MDEIDSYNRVRYYFEHRVFRDWFYEPDTGEEMVKALLKEGSSFLWNAMLHWCKETGEEIWGTKKQYKVSARKCGKGYSMLRIDMPKPQKELLCYQIYLVFGNSFRRRGYFTVERGASQKERHLCSWEQGGAGRHCNYGRCSPNASKIEKRITYIFTNRQDKFLKIWQRIWWCASAVIFIGAAVTLYAERRRFQKVYCQKKSKKDQGNRKAIRLRR